MIKLLAVRRLTTLITEDKILEKQRDALWKKYPPETTMLGFLVSCRKCSSVWAALVVLALDHWSFGRILVRTLALSEATILVDELLDRTQKPSMFN